MPTMPKLLVGAGPEPGNKALALLPSDCSPTGLPKAATPTSLLAVNPAAIVDVFATPNRAGPPSAAAAGCALKIAAPATAPTALAASSLTMPRRSDVGGPGSVSVFASPATIAFKSLVELCEYLTYEPHRVDRSSSRRNGSLRCRPQNCELLSRK